MDETHELTRFQRRMLDDVAMRIADGKECFLGVEGELTISERNYLVEALRTRHRIVIKWNALAP